jgi:hypothetical protein
VRGVGIVIHGGFDDTAGVATSRGALRAAPAPAAAARERTTVLRRGDDLLVVTPRRIREETEERLRKVSRAGRLAQWWGEE